MTCLMSAIVVSLCFLSACGNGRGDSLSKYPGTEEGARRLLTDIRTGDALAMTRALEPTSADCRAVYEGDAAGKAKAESKGSWPPEIIAADREYSELKLGKATSAEIRAWDKSAETDIPFGYHCVRGRLKPGLTFYHWQYVKPGETLGIAFTGLVHVNGHWAWFPALWDVRGLRCPVP